MKKSILAAVTATLVLSSALASAQVSVNKNGPMVNPYAASNLQVMGHPMRLQDDGNTRHTNPKEVNPWYKYVGVDTSQVIRSSSQTPSRQLP